MRMFTLAAGLMLALIAQQRTTDEPTPLQPGDTAPTFRLNDHQGQTRAVGGERDHWTVLAFYPKALTPG